MESVWKLAYKCYVKLYKLQEKLRKQLLIMLYFSLHTIAFTLRWSLYRLYIECRVKSIIY